MDMATNGAPSPFQTPLFDFPSFQVSGLLTIIFFLVFVAWAIFTVTAAYHWFRYSHRSWLAVPAVVGYIVVSGMIILYIAHSV
jgi:hypothetical protein